MSTENVSNEEKGNGVLASNVRPKLTAQEEAMFIAGFQECVKYLSMQGKGNQP